MGRKGWNYPQIVKKISPSLQYRDLKKIVSVIKRFLSFYESIALTRGMYIEAM